MTDITILSKTLPKNHFTLTSSYYVQQICNMFLVPHGISTFAHTRIFNDGSRFVLCNRSDWVEHCYNQGYVYLTRLNRYPSCYQSGIYLWDAWDPTHPGHQVVGNDAADNFNIGRGITFLEKLADWMDKYEFASTPNNYMINNFYLNNIELLKKFIQFYEINYNNLLGDALKSRAIVPQFDCIDMNEDYPDTTIPNISSNKIIVNCQATLQRSLTKRELECIYWLIRGKTSSEISMILGLSSRTIEKFIINVKEKLGCYTLFQLGQRISSLGIDQMLTNDFINVQ